MLKNIFFATFLILMSVFPAFSQSREADILSYLTTASSSRPSIDDSASSPLDFISNSSSSPLDFIGNSASSPLDFIGEGTKPTDGSKDIMAAIAALSPQMGALSYISGAYSSQGFYQSGSRSASSLGGYGAQMGNIPFYMPQWSRITSGFGYRPRFHRMHKGIDIAMRVGDTVRVVLPGRIEKVSFELNGYGNYVVVSHSNGMETRYAHLSESLVTPGMWVETGEPIALSGNTGNSTGPHLHFEARYNGEAVDPAMVFDFSGSNRMYAAAALPAQTTASMPGRALAGKSTYIVRPGDTLKKIADRAGISVLRLCQLNFLMEGEELPTGRMLKLR